MQFLLSSELAQEEACTFCRLLNYIRRGVILEAVRTFKMSWEFAQERCYTGRESHFCCRRNWLSPKSLIIFCAVISFENKIKMNENLKI